MFAYVKDGSIVSMPNGNKGIIIDGNQYSNQLFTTVYSEAERNAAGVYTVEIDETNKKDEEYYINTNITYAYDASSNKVKGTYGSATDKAIADSLYTQDDVDADVHCDVCRGRRSSGTGTPSSGGFSHRRKGQGSVGSAGDRSRRDPCCRGLEF